MVVPIKESVEKFVEYFEESINNYKNIEVKDIKERYDPSKGILICGMGGSGIAGMIIQNLYDTNIVALTTKEIPDMYKDWNIILVSYSGNTHEVLDILERYKNQVIVSLTTNGKLENKSKEYDIPVTKLPEGFIPRSSLPHMIILLTYILLGLGVVEETWISNIKATLDQLKEKKTSIINEAENTAQKINSDDILVFLSTFSLFPAAYRSKTQINENCKMHAYAEHLSEHNHNSIMALKQNLKNIFYVIYYDDRDPQMRIRFDFLINELKKREYRYKVVKEEGDLMRKMLHYIFFGDVLSVSIAKRFKINMEEVDIIKELKKTIDDKIF